MSPTENILHALSERGLLLKQDKVLASVVGIVTGESLRGSWWAHPQARLIFSVHSDLADHPDVLLTKLISGKDTLVHRRLWPSLLGVAVSGQPWQFCGLSEPTLELFELATRQGSVQSSGPVARSLAVRLLVSISQVHTDSGKHALVLESWTSWAARARCSAQGSVAGARRALEEAALGLGARLSALPWVRFDVSST